jgi:hypothetical protein
MQAQNLSIVLEEIMINSSLPLSVCHMASGPMGLSEDESMETIDDEFGSTDEALFPAL